ncbi:hypothetical protein WA538_002510, partial [Blastocystis sp. DL]
MFSQWMEAAKESASKLLSNGKEILTNSVQQLQAASDELNQKANDYIRDNLIKAPKDMTYITNNLIAMGFPGNPQTHKTETSVNKMDMTAYYLDAHHPNHYKLFNLAEETYDTLIFHGMVENYNFHGFPAPTLGLLIHICTSIESWLCEDPANVAVVHCYDGKGRTMVVCACVMAWMGWFNSPVEALAICLDRRGLDETAVLPSQQRTLQYFDSLLQGVRPSPAGLQLTEVTVSYLPDMGQGLCCPTLEVYCQDRRVCVSRGSTLKAGETVSFTPNVVLRGTVLLRLRHTPAGTASTLLRAQFHTGFVKLFRQSFPAGACDGGEKLPAELEVTCVFAPSEVPREAGDPYEELISRESSALWGEVMRRKESRMGRTPAQDAFVVGNTRGRRVEVAKVASRDYLTELSRLEAELKEMEEVPAGETEVEAGVDVDKILKNYDLEGKELDAGTFDLGEYEDVLKEAGVEDAQDTEGGHADQDGDQDKASDQEKVNDQDKEGDQDGDQDKASDQEKVNDQNKDQDKTDNPNTSHQDNKPSDDTTTTQ